MVEAKEQGVEDTATGGAEEQEDVENALKLWKAFHELNLDPGVENPEDLEKFLKSYSKRAQTKEAEMKATPMFHMPTIVPNATTATTTASTATTTASTAATTTQASAAAAVPTQVTAAKSFQFPKMSLFSGDGNKGETSWEGYKFEIDALVEEKQYAPEQIMLGIRHTTRGTAADIVRRLGTGVTIDDVLKKFNSTFGTIESKRSVLRKIYSCTQGTDSVKKYASRLEDYFAQGVELGAMRKGDDDLLKELLYQGLKVDLKLQAQYKYETIHDYDRFKIELRSLEEEMNKPEEAKPKPCHATQRHEEYSEMGQLKDTVKALQERIKHLEKEKNSPTVEQQPIYLGNRGYRRGRYRGGNQGGRGRGQYTPKRPIAINTFRGACHRCGERGHMAKDCPVEYRDENIVCHRCGEKGHYAKECKADYKEIQKKKDLKD